MKPPPGPMFRFDTAARPRPVRPPVRVAAAAAVDLPRGNHRRRTVACAVALAAALVLAGAALLAPYAGVPAATPTGPTPTALNPTALNPMAPTTAAP